jgi:starvation-inducible outer membrane lipoprotein
MLTSAAALALALAGCATAPAATISNEAVTDLNLIASAFQPLGDAVASMAGATPAVIAQVNTDIAQLEAAALAVAPGVSTAVAQPSVATVGSAFQSILAALQGLTLPSNIQAVLMAAETLLPLIQAAVGIAVAVGASETAMTPDQARLVLQGASH